MLTLLGATGYTGRLVAAELARRGLPLRLAGRDAAALEALAATLPTRPATLVVDIANPPTLLRLVEGTMLLVSCAGPFTDVGEPVAALAARHGLCYLDTTNELAFVHNVYRRLDPVAQSTGATLVPACGFEVALSDCAAALLAQRLPQPLDEIAVTYRLPGMGSSHGTRASALRSLATSWLAYRGGQLIAERPGRRVRQLQLAGKPVWALVFPSSETMTIPAQLRVRDVAAWMVVSPAAARYGPWLIPLTAMLVRGPLGPLLRRLAVRAAPPPDPQTRATMPFALRVDARTSAESASLVLQGHDPYGLTATIIGYAAAHMFHAQLPAGVLPPARALNPSDLLATLQANGFLSINNQEFSA